MPDFKHLLAVAGALAMALPVCAANKEAITLEEERTEADASFRLGLPVWIAGVTGDVGVPGRTVPVDVDAEKIFDNLNMVGAFNAQYRRGRFGIYGDFLYLSIDAQARSPHGGAHLDIRLDQTLASLCRSRVSLYRCRLSPRRVYLPHLDPRTSPDCLIASENP